MGDWFKSVLDYVRAWLVSVFISSRQEALAYLDRKVKEADEYTDRKKAEVKTDALRELSEGLDEIDDYIQKHFPFLPDKAMNDLKARLVSKAAEFYDKLSAVSKEKEDEVLQDAGKFVKEKINEVYDFIEGKVK